MNLDPSGAGDERLLVGSSSAAEPVGVPGPGDGPRSSSQSGLVSGIWSRLVRRPIRVDQAGGHDGLHVLGESFCHLPDGTGGRIALRKIEGGHWVETCVPDR